MTDNTDDPIVPIPPPDNIPPPHPERGKQGEAGEEGTRQGVGGHGGAGGRGGRGGIGLMGFTGARGPRGPAGVTGPGPRGAQGPAGAAQTRSASVALFVVVALCALSAIFYSTRSEHRLDQAAADRDHLTADQAVFDEQVVCVHDAIVDTLKALRARSAFAEQQAETSLAGDLAQRTYLNALLDPDTGNRDGVRLTVDYLNALTFKIQATREQLAIRAAAPYPSDTAVDECVP